MSRRIALIVSVSLLVALAGSTSAVGAPQAASSRDASAATIKVPNLRGKKLPYAEVLLRRAGLRVGREDCDCTFGVVIKSNWYVCEQWPKAGRVVARRSRVDTYSARSVDDC